jgi:hypothetical protein
MAEMNPSLTAIVLNVNGLNFLVERQRLLQWIKKQTQDDHLL